MKKDGTWVKESTNKTTWETNKQKHNAGTQAGGGTLLPQEHLSRHHPGRLLAKQEEQAWTLIQRQHQDQPSSCINGSHGVMHHKDNVVEVYQVTIEENMLGGRPCQDQ